MNVMRFVGRTSREAMRRLREALGPDALVLANRPCPEGIEILAAAPDALGAVTVSAHPPRHAPAATARGASERPGVDRDAAGAPSMSTVSFQDYVRQRLRERSRSSDDPGPPQAAPPAAAAAAPPAPARAPAASAVPVSPAARPASRPVAAGAAASVGAGPGAVATGPAPAPIAQPAAFDAGGLLGPIPTWPAREPEHFPARSDDPFATPWLTGVAAGPAAGRPGAEPLATALRARADGVQPAAATDALVGELHSLKQLLSRQFSTMSWFEGVRRSPIQGQLLRTMVAAGFSLKLARAVVARLPSDFCEADARLWLEQVLARNLRCASGPDCFDAGGVFALVGPTGVGKTTTTAKIAARHVLRHGPQSVALITVDTYRLGAHDQLRAFGRILGVPVHIAHDAGALHDLLRLRGSRQLVLIDTVGMGQRDERIGTLLMSLPRPAIRHVVVASGAAQAEAIDEALRAYDARHAEGVVLTKLDESARLGGALDCLLRQRLQLLGTCNGQRVPEDWHPADPGQLVRRALAEAPAGAFSLGDEDLPLVFGVAASRQGDIAHA